MQILVIYSPRNKQQARALLRRRLAVLLGLLLAFFIMLLDARSEMLHPLRRGILQCLTPFSWPEQAATHVGRFLGNYWATHQSLRTENQWLQEQLLVTEGSLQKLQILEDENAQLRALLEAKANLQTDVYLASVQQVALSAYSHQLILDVGSLSGIKLGQAVLTQNGVVGLVISVTDNDSVVLLITDPNHGVPVKNARTNNRMIARGGGRFDRLYLSHLAETTDIQPGDQILTSGVGGHFPEGYPVGRVLSVVHNTGDPFVTVVVEPFAHLADLNKVLIVMEKDE